MTEDEARDLLMRAGHDDLEPWIAMQNWQAVHTGWRLVPDLEGWHFRIAVAGTGQMRITAIAPGGDPTV